MRHEHGTAIHPARSSWRGLRAEIAPGRPLVMTGAGNGNRGEVHRAAAASISSGSTTPATSGCRATARSPACCRSLDSNETGLPDGASREVLPQVRVVPVVAGVNGVDPLRDMRLFLEDLKHIGVLGRPQLSHRRVV